MVKSLRFLVILIAVAAFGVLASLNASSAYSATCISSTDKAVTAPNDFVFYLDPNTDNKTCADKAVYVSKQLLPSNGLGVHAKAVREDNSSQTALFFSDLNSIKGSATNQLLMTFDIKNGTFSQNLVLLLDNGSITTEIQPSYQSATTVSFTIDNASVEANNYKELRLVDQASDYTNTTFHVKIDGSLNDGDAVGLSVTSTFNGKHIFNGCFKRVLYIVENQWIAHLCSCPTGGIDTDNLVASDNGITVQDVKVASAGYDGTGFSLYNACTNYKEHTNPTTTCCGTIDSSCSLFCNYTETGSATTSTANCSVPGTCYCDATSTGGIGGGLAIYENQDFYTHPSYKVITLNETPVTFTLTGNDLKDMASITLVSYNDLNSTGGFAQPAVIGTFVVNGDKATVTIPGSVLFVSTNGGIQTHSWNTPIHFKVEITPKSNVSLMPNKFYLSAVIETGGEVVNPEDLDWGEFLDWTWGNGSYVFKAPYVREDSSITSVIRLENAGTKDVGVSLYVDNPDGSSWTFVKHIIVAAGTSVAVRGSELISYAKDAGITLDGTKGFAVRGVANTTEDTFTVYGSQQYIGTTDFRPMPIKVMHNGDDVYSE